MSALPPKADIAKRDRRVPFVPEASFCRSRNQISRIDSSARLVASRLHCQIKPQAQFASSADTCDDNADEDRVTEINQST